MHASDIQVELPLVDRSTNAVEAARLIAENRFAALVVADPTGRPVAVVSSADVLGLLIPNYVLDDMALAGVIDEAGAEEMWAHAAGRTIGELLDDDEVSVRELLRVDSDSTLLEIATLMVDAHAQIAAVKGTPGGFVTLPAVMDGILSAFDAPGAPGAAA
ncbi:CBS domain-containing protein [Microbacterium sp. NEAU-LLC]|uniref:CBS domain-containing protein n=1 Tax=Microbacterium helvum TaxID=2773713 RepID=A0ABR8NIK2_9MICO|nr:CBS domain-containing protein [Microbacterium helvum]MBD3940515.1 CBS domain-containing protein [Microbacterium helvum]